MTTVVPKHGKEYMQYSAKFSVTLQNVIVLMETSGPQTNNYSQVI